MKAALSVYAPVYPTEDIEKVKKAITNIFPVELLVQDNGTPGLHGEGDIESLRKLHFLLRDGRILDTMRKVLLSAKKGCRTCFRLNKQVAYVGKVNISDGNESLGPIDVEISAENEIDILHIIDWLAPVTVDGKPVEEIEL